MTAPTPRRPIPAVFLDRDGTLNVERGPCGDPAAAQLLPGAACGVARLHAAGYRPIVITNQSGVARGYYTEADVARVHWHLHELLGGRVAAWLHCPHHPCAQGSAPGGDRYTRTCSCRKPGGGLLARAAQLFDLDLGRSWVVGDAARDLQAGAVCGVRGILVESGKDAREELALLEDAGLRPAAVCGDLRAAAEHILGIAPQD